MTADDDRDKAMEIAARNGTVAQQCHQCDGWCPNGTINGKCLNCTK